MPTPRPEVKFCGLTSREAVDAAVRQRVSHVGFVHFPPSPRHLDFSAMAALVRRVPGDVRCVGVFVDADDETLAAGVAAGLSTLQLHGCETPERVAAVKARFPVAVWRAHGVRTRADIAEARGYIGAADLLLFDAKAPKPAPGQAMLPGGNGLRFDWSLLDGFRAPRWGLSGGLDAASVADAVRTVRPGLLDVSTGIEDAPGIKSLAKMAAFMEAVTSL